jgi:FtsX-like permease family
VSHHSGLPGAVLQRSLADWPVVLAAWLLLVSATTLLATGVVYGDAVASSGLHRSILAAPPASRAVVVVMSSETAAIDGLDGAIRPTIQAAIAATGGEIARVVKTGSFADPAVASDQVRDLTSFESLDGIEEHARLIGGVWPQAGADPLQTTLSEPAATALNLHVGDHLSLVNRNDASVRVDIVVSGVWRADPADAFWLDDPLETSGVRTEGTFTTRGPLVISEADLVSLGGGPDRVDLSWRAIPDVQALRVDRLDDLRNGVDGLAAQFRELLPASISPRVQTAMPALLSEVGRSVLVSRSGVILLTIQFAVLAGYSIVLVAGMLVERRRSEIALMRSRGASGGHLIAMAIFEAAILAIPAAILAPWLALGIVALLGTVGPAAGLGIASSAAIGVSALVVSALAGLACIVALTLPTLFVSASPAGARAAEGRQARTTLPQRLGLDLALIAVAGVALWQLRLYGAPLTRNAQGTLGLDPLLVAAPAIGLVGGAVLALRVVPRIAELGERLLVRGRGLVGSLGGRQLARRPLRYTRAALLLMLAAALGTLAMAHAATWGRSQADQATYQAAADVRVVAADYSKLPAWAAGPLYRSIPGVRQASPVTVAPFDLGRTIRDGRLVGLDATTVGNVLRPQVATAGSASAADLLATLAPARPKIPTLALPSGTQRLAVTVDPALDAEDLFAEEPTRAVLSPTSGTLSVSAILADADGRLFRTAIVSGTLTAGHQRLVIPIVDPAAGVVDGALRPTGPLRLDAIELVIDVTDQVAVFGSVDLVSVEASPAVAGDAGWAAVTVDPRAPGWGWRRISQQEDVTFTPTPERPGRVSISHDRPIPGGEIGFGTTTFRLGASLPDDVALPAIASTSFLAQTGNAVGDSLLIASLAVPVRVTIVAATDLFAPLDPAVPYLVTDLAAYDAIQFAATGQTRQADEWWLSVAPSQTAAVVDRLRQPSASARAVIGRDELARNLSTDPVPLGLIGILGLGSLAAMLFAGIGFLVSSTVSTSQRLAEFALLRALGLSTGQLALWLSIESIFLLVVGLLAGSVLGVVLAWLVLPFATLTQTGATPIPAPVVVIPWESIAPVYLAAVVLFVVSIWLVRRQLPDVRISGVLRAGQS